MNALKHAVAIVVALALTSCGESEPAVEVTAIVPGSVMHGVQGMALDADGMLYGASFFGQAVYKIDPQTGNVEFAVPPPAGESDDLTVGPPGTPVAGMLVWASVDGIHTRNSDGTVRDLVHAPRANPVAFSKEGRLFFAQSGTPDNELWELDPLGQKPPRLITKGQGRLNGFTVGPDGRIYSPLFGTDQVVAIDVESGEHTVVGKGLGTPSAVRVDPQGDIIAVDYLLGDVWHLDRATGASRKLANVPPVLDNLAIAPDGTIYLASTADSTIWALNPETGAVRAVVKGTFNTPLGAAFTTFNGKPSLLIAQPQSFAYVDPVTAEVSRPFYDAGRNGSDAIAANERTIVTTRGGRLRKFDRASDTVVAETMEVKTPAGVVLAENGDAIVADADSGRIVIWTGDGIKPVAEGFARPTGLALESPMSLLVVETGAGQVTRVDLASGERTVVLKGVDGATGIALLKDGRIAVAEPAKGVVVAFDPNSGARTELATGLPLAIDKLRIPTHTPVGMAVGPDGTLCVVGSADNSLWKIRFAAR